MLVAVDLVLLPAGVGAFAWYVDATASTQVQLAGFASLANPLTKATVNVYEMSSAGKPGQLLASATTDDKGYYAVTVYQPPASWLLVSTSGGTYIDQLSKKPVTAGPNDFLRTVLLPNASLASLTPLTTFATARASALASSGKPLGHAIEASFGAVARQYGLYAVADMYPSVANLAPEQQDDISDLPSRQLGLILAGLDVEANALGTSEFALTNALARDSGDGNFDGKDGSNPVLIGSSPAVALPPDAAGAKLQAAINQVAASPANALHISAPVIFSGPTGVNVNTAGLYWVSTTVLPAWIEGQAGTASIAGVGGTKPYSCSLVGGQLPSGFSLVPGTCQITGLAPVQTGMSISAPFGIRMTDSSHPAQSVTTDLHITIVPKPPVAKVGGGACPGPNQKCDLPGFVTATGGTSPYYFTRSGGAFPPIGMILFLDGSLRGTPSKAGTSAPFEVCAVDLIGSLGCLKTTLTVGNPPTPPPTARPTAPPIATAPPGPPPPPDQSRLTSVFPANLPSGTYNISICTVADGCSVVATKQVTNGDARGIQVEISIAQGEVQSACGDGSVRYTPFSNGSFDVVFNCTTGGSGGSPTPWLHIARVG
jgi:hypothetical protein